MTAVAMATAVCASAQDKNYELQDVVVTGTRNATDQRHLPLTVTVVDNEKLNEQYRTSVLPTVMEQTPGLFTTSRGILGYGVSTGAAGSMKIRGIGSGAELLVLIDGQPQYAGLWKQRHGGCGEHRDPTDASGWREDGHPTARRKLRHFLS